MKKVFYLIAVAGLVITSCAKTDNPNPNKGKTYSFEIGAERETDEDGAPETRIQFINDALYWSVGDRVGMFVHEGTTQRINNLAMTGKHTQPATSTSFVGELSQSEIASLDPNKLYQYVTYFPYNATGTRIIFGGGNKPFIEFHTTTNIQVRKNEFPSDYALMYSIATNLPPMTWLDGNGEQQYGERLDFNYKHVYSYLRLKLDINLMSLPVTKIEIIGSNVSGNRYQINLDDGHTSVFNTGNRIVNIDGGMNVGDEIYIPIMPIVYSANGLTFRFTFSNGVTYDKVISNRLTLQRGKVHNIAFKLPFIADFEKYPGLPYIASSLPASGQFFDYLGHTYRGYRIGVRNATYLSFGDSMVTGTIETPALNLGGKTSIPVEVRTRAAYQTRYGMGTIDIDAVNGYYGTDYTTFRYSTPNNSNIIQEYSISGIPLTPATPKIAIRGPLSAMYSLEVHPL